MQLPREPRTGDPLDGAWGAQVIRYLRAITPRSGPGVRVREFANGTTFEAAEVKAGTVTVAAPHACPFDITLTPNSGDFTATFRAGTINQLLPSNYHTGVFVPASGTRYLVLSCTVAGGAITAAAFSADASPPPAIAPYAGEPPTSLKILIGVSIDGVATKVWGCGNITAMPVEAFRVQKTVPVAGQVPYDVYYTWQIALSALA